jgi:nucleotide-binding universal stress UspA family protein
LEIYTMGFRSILCPVDFSAQSRGALRYAAAVAQRFGGRVTVMFVNDPLLLAAGRIQYGGQRRFVDRTRAELARFVEQSIRTSRLEQKTVAFDVAVGNPADEILRAARRLRSDLVVMGTHGLSGVRRLFFGSTTEQVLRRATVPVLATPPSLDRRRAPGVAMTITGVIAPLDLAGEWRSDVTRAAAIAVAFDAELHLVHVLARIQTPPWLRSTTGATERRRIDKAARTLERVRTTLCADLRSTSTVLTGNPAHEIAQLTSRAGSLVVMSLRGTAGVWGARRGSIAYHVLTHSATPVLALPRRRLGGRFSVRAKRAVTGALSARDRVEIAGIDALLSIASGRRPLKR